MAVAAEFKAAMRQLASTVSLVTTQEDGDWYGMPATAVTSLSAAPPSLLVCINQSASMHGPTARSSHFCINMLGSHHAALCEDFGRHKGSARFTVGQWRGGRNGLPYIADAAAVIFCAVEKTMDFGTHTIFAGTVEAIIVDPLMRPLIFQAGRMGQFLPFDDPSH